jgi:FkbM family methyltransferase
MKNLTTIKEHPWQPTEVQKEWVWPKEDQASWDAQLGSRYLFQSILPLVNNKNIMIQAGGNCGLVLSQFVEHFNTIYTFEPDPVNFYCLNQNITSANVIKIQACLGDISNPVQVQHLIRPDNPHDIGGVHVHGSGVTPVIVIDNLNLPGCDLIQLDIEGYELHALRGAINTIKKFKPVICVEIFEPWLNRYESNSEKILDFLTNLNYILIGEAGVDKIFIYNK